MARLSRFQRSQKAHARLNKVYIQRGNTAKNRAFGNYHAECIERQTREKKVLSKAERRKMFSWWCKSEGYNLK